MINLKNSFILAGTKLKTHKIRLILSVITSSLLFSLIIFGIVVYQGAVIDTLKRFSQIGLSGRSILEVHKKPVGEKSYREITINSDDYKKLEQIWLAQVDLAEKTAKKLDLAFDKEAYKEQISPFAEVVGRGETKEQTVYYIDGSENLVAKKFFEQQSSGKKLIDAGQLKLIEKSAKKKGGRYFSGYDLSFLGSRSVNFDSKNNRYNWSIKKEAKQSRSEQLFRDPMSIFDSKEKVEFYRLEVLPEEINKAFLIDHDWQPSKNTIPIMLPINFIEQLLDIKPLSSKSSKEELIEHNRQVIKKAKGFQFKQCLLNQEATHQLELANQHEQAVKEDKKHQNESNYIKTADQMPLIYKMPAGDVCQLPQLVKDNRSPEEKQLDVKQQQFEQIIEGKVVVPAKATELRFELVGILPATSNPFLDQRASLADSILRMIISAPSSRAIVPEQLFNQYQNKSQLVATLATDYKSKERYLSDSAFLANIDNQTVEQRVFVELEDGKSAHQFTVKHDCYFDQDSSYGEFNLDRANQECPANQSFSFTPFANSQTQIYQMTKGVWNIIKVISTVFGGVAALILFGVVSRLLADNRKETAVFRAIGFKRSDISLIYISYTFLISLAIIVCSTILALIVSFIVNNTYQKQFTTQAIYAFNLSNFNLQASFIGWDWQMIGLVYGLIIAAGFVSLIIPLLLSIRRNPINDMRSE